MLSFKEFCENREIAHRRPKGRLRHLGVYPRDAGGDRDSEQLRRLGLDPRGMSVGRFPQHDFDMPPAGDDDEDDVYINRRHATPSNFGVGSPTMIQPVHPGHDEPEPVPPSQYHEPLPYDQLPPDASVWDDHWHIPPHMQAKKKRDTKGRASTNIATYLLGRLKDAGVKYGNSVMYKALMKDRSSKTDWLAAADWLDENGDDLTARAFRRYVKTFYT